MTRNGRPPSMADVAELVGVSHQTVSRVVNGKGRVSPRTRERVQAAIDQLGYRPNSVARALVTARSGIIGVVTTTSAHFGPSSMLVALEVAAREAGLFTSVVALDRFGADDVASAFDHFSSLAAEAIVVIAPVDSLAEAVASQGAMEVTLLGQNVNSYGVGFGERGAFADLLRAVGRVEGIERVRFTSPHPAAFTDDVIAAMAETPTVMPSLHMPLQSGSDAILRQMRRSYRRERFMGILERVRAAIPEAAITTDIIVGFPGETEEDFQATLDVVEQARFTSAFTFLYSRRPGTPAADREDQVPDDVALERYQRLVKLQERICAEDNAALAGTDVEILVSEGDGRKDGSTHRISGRARDNRLVHVALPEGLAQADRPRPGDMIRATVTYGAPHHLIADSGAQGGLFEVRRTRAGDAWQARQAKDEPDTAVSLGIPTLRVGAPR